MTASATVEIVNKKGLHARAAAKFVKIVAAHKAEVLVAKEGGDSPVPGGSILGLMMLGADIGSTLTITANGEQAEAVVKMLVELVSNKFGEAD